MMEIESWAEDLTKEFFFECRSKYYFWKLGFKIFYGPVRKRPNLLILSFNPGGDEKSFRGEDFKSKKNYRGVIVSMSLALVTSPSFS